MVGSGGTLIAVLKSDILVSLCPDPGRRRRFRPDARWAECTSRLEMHCTLTQTHTVQTRDGGGYARRQSVTGKWGSKIRFYIMTVCAAGR